MNDKLQGEKETAFDQAARLGVLDFTLRDYLNEIERLRATLASDAQPQAPKVPEVAEPVAVVDPGFHLRWNVAGRIIKPGTKLYLEPPSTAQAVEAALRNAAEVAKKYALDELAAHEAEQEILALIPNEAVQVEPEAGPVYQTKLPSDGLNVWRDVSEDIFNISEVRRIVYTEAAMVLAEEQLRHERGINERLCKALNAENGPTFMGEPALAQVERDAKDVELLAALQQAHMALIGYLPSHRNAVTNAAIEACAAAIDSAKREG